MDKPPNSLPLHHNQENVLSLQKEQNSTQEPVRKCIYWDRKGLNEIDMIALNDIDKTAVVAEIKRQGKKFSPGELADKVATLGKELGKYSVNQIGLCMEDM